VAQQSVNGLASFIPLQESVAIEVIYSGLTVFSGSKTLLDPSINISIEPVLKVQANCVDIGNSFTFTIG